MVSKKKSDNRHRYISSVLFMCTGRYFTDEERRIKKQGKNNLLCVGTL